MDCRGSKSILDHDPPKSILDPKTIPRATAQTVVRPASTARNNNNSKSIIVTTSTSNNNITNRGFKILQDKIPRSSTSFTANGSRDGEEDVDGDDDEGEDGDDDDDEYGKSREHPESVTEDTDTMVSKMRLDDFDEGEEEDDRMDDYGDIDVDHRQVHAKFPANNSSVNGEQEFHEWSVDESEDTDDEDYDDDEFIDLKGRNQDVERGRYHLLGTNVVGSSSSSSASGYKFYNDKDDHEARRIQHPPFVQSGTKTNQYAEHGQQRVEVPDVYDESSNKRHRETIEIDFISGRTLNRRRGNDVIRFTSSASVSLQRSLDLAVLLSAMAVAWSRLSYFKILFLVCNR